MLEYSNIRPSVMCVVFVLQACFIYRFSFCYYSVCSIFEWFIIFLFFIALILVCLVCLVVPLFPDTDMDMRTTYTDTTDIGTDIDTDTTDIGTDIDTDTTDIGTDIDTDTTDIGTDMDSDTESIYITDSGSDSDSVVFHLVRRPRPPLTDITFSIKFNQNLR